MDAKIAGGAPVTDATEPNTDTSTEVKPELNPGSARVAAILEEEGLSEETPETQPKDQTHAEKTETPGSDRAQENARAGEAAEGEAEPEGEEKGKGPESADRKAKGKGQGDPEEELTPEQTKAWPAEALQRIHKKTAQNKALLARAEKAEQQLQAATRPPVEATRANPLADINTPEEMTAAIADYEGLLYWAESNPDGVADHPIGKNADGSPITKDYSAADMARIRAEAGLILRKHVPERVQLLRQQWQHEQVAKEKLPEMFEPGTEANQFLESARAEVPGLTNIPGFHQWVRWAWMGRKADIEAAEKAGKNGNGNGDGKKPAARDPKVAVFLQKHPPLAPSMPSARDGAAPSTAKTVEKAQERVLAGEGEEAEDDLIASLRSSQSSKKGAVVV